MTLQERCEKDKLTMIALYALLRECARDLSLALEGSLSEICRGAGVNRTQLYERKGQLWEALSSIELAGPGRPSAVVAPTVTDEAPGPALRVQVLRYRLAHPGAMVMHRGGHTTYSDGFRRFILDLEDAWEGERAHFCQWAELPGPTLCEWRAHDREPAYPAYRPRQAAALPASATEACRDIVDDYARWEGRLRDFLRYEAQRLHLAVHAIRRVLTIAGELPVRSFKPPRYRDTTRRCRPGTILVTDGKEIETVSSASGEVRCYNWQGIVDQATACHTAVVITEHESAEGVRQAYEDSCAFAGRAPQALVHDNKPIHQDAALHEAIEAETLMLPATPGRPENKAVIEGEFGNYEQAVGVLHLDDSSIEALRRSAVHEAVRAYVAGINHAGRAELDGQSRQQVLRQSCPDPAADRAFVERLHAEHTRPRREDPLETSAVARRLLDAGFARLELEAHDRTGELRTWLGSRYTPAAIRRGLALFGGERAKGRLRNKNAHRYLVKLIQSAQEELDLREQEDWLRTFAEVERQAWLGELEQAYGRVKAEHEDAIGPASDLAFGLSEQAVFGGLPLARAFWEDKLKALLERQAGRFEAVRRHVRRLYEAPWNDRFWLIARLTEWEAQLA